VRGTREVRDLPQPNKKGSLSWELIQARPVKCAELGGFSFGAGLPVENTTSHASMNFSVTVDQTRRGYRLLTTNGLSSSIAAEIPPMIALAGNCREGSS
jgi:hypothetical protein